MSYDIFKQRNFLWKWTEENKKRLVVKHWEVGRKTKTLKKSEMRSFFMLFLVLRIKNIYLLIRLKFLSRHFKVKRLIH